MYDGDPTISPVAVSRESSRIVATPKSVSLARSPACTITFAGLTSRWTTPTTWAASSAVRTSSPIRAALRVRDRAAVDHDPGQAGRVDQLHHEPDRPGLLDHVEHGHHARVVEPGRGLRLPQGPAADPLDVLLAGHQLDLLYRHAAIEPGIDGAEHRRPAAPKRRAQPVAAGQARRGRRRRRLPLRVHPITSLSARRGRRACRRGTREEAGSTVTSRSAREWRRRALANHRRRRLRPAPLARCQAPLALWAVGGGSSMTRWRSGVACTLLSWLSAWPSCSGCLSPVGRARAAHVPCRADRCRWPACDRSGRRSRLPRGADPRRRSPPANQLTTTDTEHEGLRASDSAIQRPLNMTGCR